MNMMEQRISILEFTCAQNSNPITSPNSMKRKSLAQPGFDLFQKLNSNGFDNNKRVSKLELEVRKLKLKISKIPGLTPSPADLDKSCIILQLM